MVSIPSINLVSLANLPRIQESDAIKAAAQRVQTAIASDAADATQAIARAFDTSSAANTVGTSTPQGGAGTAAPTGFTATPRLSANVLDALLSSQAQQSAASTSPNNTPATTLSGASEVEGPPAASSGSPSSDPSSSKPETLQDIASQFDLHNLTNTQFESLAKQLSAAGAISGSALFDIAQKLGGLGVSPALEGKPVTDKVVSIWDGVKDDTPPYDVVSKVQGWLAADTEAGYPQAQTDQQIFNALNQVSAIRNGATA